MRPSLLPKAENDGKWHQIVETYDGGSVGIYFDGASIWASRPSPRNTTIDSIRVPARRDHRLR